MKATFYTVVYETSNPTRWWWYVGKDTFASSHFFQEPPSKVAWMTLSQAKRVLRKHAEQNAMLVKMGIDMDCVVLKNKGADPALVAAG